MSDNPLDHNPLDPRNGDQAVENHDGVATPGNGTLTHESADGAKTETWITLCAQAAVEQDQSASGCAEKTAKPGRRAAASREFGRRCSEEEGVTSWNSADGARCGEM